MGKHLSDAQVAGYHRDGCLFPIDVFAPDVAAGYRARMEALEAGHSYGDSLLFIVNGRALRAAETIGRHLGGLRWLDQFEAALGRSVQAGQRGPQVQGNK